MGKVTQVITVSSFLQFLSEPKLQSLQGPVLSFSSITQVSACFGNAASYCSLQEVCWEHCHILDTCKSRKGEVLVSRVTDTPHLYLF